MHISIYGGKSNTNIHTLEIVDWLRKSGIILIYEGSIHVNLNRYSIENNRESF